MFVVSLRWYVGWQHVEPPADQAQVRQLNLGGGALGYFHFPRLAHVKGTPGATCFSFRVSSDVVWRPDFHLSPGTLSMKVPLWMPFALWAIPTITLFALDLASARRRRMGQCAKCGYDRAGLAPGAVCPECGGAWAGG
jgi:hypothetical protein